MNDYNDSALSKAVSDVSDGSGFYSLDKIGDRLEWSMISWIVGERRIGKTDFFLRLACRLWAGYGRKTMWLRNKKVELESMDGFLNDAILHGWCPPEWETRPDGVYDGDDKIIIFQSLSTFSNRRGAAEPDVDMIVLDEFMPEDRRYPPNAAIGLMSLTKTVFSGRPGCRCFCLSNIVSAANPYFARFRIYPGKDDITEYRDAGMLIEKCKGYKKAIASSNPWTAVYKAGGYGDYADESEDSLLDFCKSVPKGAIESSNLILVNGSIYAIYSHKGIYYTAPKKGNIPQRYSIYTPNPQEMDNRTILMNAAMKQALKDWIDNGAMRFSDPNTMFDVFTIVYTTC